jgi:hypothetical protein
MVRHIILAVSLLALAGCAHAVGYAGAHPGYIKCKGKGMITGTGQQGISAGLGGTGQNSFTLMVDCGDGLEYSQGVPAPAK